MIATVTTTDFPDLGVNLTNVPASTSMFAPVADDIARVERVLIETLAEYRSPIAPLVEHLKQYRGKRLRPALLLLTAKACGGVQPEHRTLAAAVEMIHTATLVHDDVLDEAETRRHVRTVNAEWGNKISILLGDMLFTHAFHLTSKVDQRACGWIGEATNRVCAGELRQVCERGNLHITEADYYEMVDGKTAALTELAGRLGATYAGADTSISDAMADYGRNLGIAFQIADDLLDLTGDEATTGKTLGTDLVQGKMTLPLIHCLNQLDATSAQTLRQMIQAKPPHLGNLVREYLAETGSIAYAQETAERFARDAIENLSVLHRSEYRTLLEQITHWAIGRSR